MTLPAFVTVVSIAIGFVGALFFCVGAAKLDRKAIAALAGTAWDANSNVAAFYRNTKADYLCGGIALCISFTLQFIAAVPGLLPDSLAFEQPWSGAIVAILVGAGSGGMLWFVRARLIAQLAADQPRGERAK